MSPYCDWCGRAISLAKFQRSGLRWFAVKGAERGYDPLVCDANTDDGLHEPATASDASTASDLPSSTGTKGDSRSPGEQL